MIISCEACNKKFEINSNLIPSEGRSLQCGSCNNKWFFKKTLKKEKKIILDKQTENIKKKVPDDTEELISEAENAISKTNYKKSKKNKINILSFLIIFVITTAALIILADTFKNFINLFIPGFDLILNNLYESLISLVKSISSKGICWPISPSLFTIPIVAPSFDTPSIDL